MISITPKEILHPVAITSDPPSLSSQETTHQLSVSLGLPVLDVLCKWNHKIQISQFCNCLAHLCVRPLPLSPFPPLSIHKLVSFSFLSPFSSLFPLFLVFFPSIPPWFPPSFLKHFETVLQTL